MCQIYKSLVGALQMYRDHGANIPILKKPVSNVHESKMELILERSELSCEMQRFVSLGNISIKYL